MQYFDTVQTLCHYYCYSAFFAFHVHRYCYKSKLFTLYLVRNACLTLFVKLILVFFSFRLFISVLLSISLSLTSIVYRTWVFLVLTLTRLIALVLGCIAVCGFVLKKGPHLVAQQKTARPQDWILFLMVIIITIAIIIKTTTSTQSCSFYHHIISNKTRPESGHPLLSVAITTTLTTQPLFLVKGNL